MKKNLTFLYRNKKNIKIAGEIIHFEESLRNLVVYFNFIILLLNIVHIQWGRSQGQMGGVGGGGNHILLSPTFLPENFLFVEKKTCPETFFGFLVLVSKMKFVPPPHIFWNFQKFAPFLTMFLHR